MDEPINTSVSEMKEPLLGSNPEPTKKAPARSNRVVKPTVEGINSPVVSMDSSNGKSFTDSEKKLINGTENEDRVMPRKQTPLLVPYEEPKSSKSWLWTVLLIIILGAGLGTFIWYKNTPQSPTAQNVVPTPVTDSTTVPTTTDVSTVPSFTDTSTPSQITTPTSSSTGASASTTPSNVNSTLKISTTPTGYLNVRALPQSGSTLVTQVHPGETYSYTEIKGGWYRIVLNDGTAGWVSGQYVTKVSATK